MLQAEQIISQKKEFIMQDHHYHHRWSVDDEGNTDLHKYAISGDLEKFKASFEELINYYQNDYLEIVSKYNKYRETALVLAIEHENFDIVVYLLSQLNNKENDEQFDKIVSIASEKMDNLLEYIKEESRNIEPSELKEIKKLLTHTASELKANRHGGDFQTKLLMLFAYDGHVSDIKFRLATEMKEADKFDDLVFRYRDNDSNNYKYRFLQAKHSQHLKRQDRIKIDNLLGITSKDDFNLSKYFTSYLRDKEQFEKDGHIIEDMILCTNNSFAFNVVQDFYLKLIEDGENKYKVFSDLGGKLYQFSDSDKVERLKEILTGRLEDLKEDEKIEKIEKFLNKINKNPEQIAEFLNKLVFAVEQPSSIVLGKIIKKKMGSDTYNVISFATFKDHIEEWFSHRGSDNAARFIFSSEIKHFFDDLKYKFAHIVLNGLPPFFKKKIKKFTDLKLRFSGDNDVDEVKKFLKSTETGKRILQLIYQEKDDFLSIAKVHQVLNEQYEDTTQYTFSDLQSLSLIPESVVDAFNSENRNLLIIECGRIDEDGENLITKFCNEVLGRSNSNNKKVIFVVNKGVTNELDQILEKSLKNSFDKINMENKFNSLTAESQDEILKTKIKFNGNERMLSSLISINDLSTEEINNLDKFIDEDTLIALINEDSNIISSEHEYEFDTYIDIPRSLNYQTKIDKKCFTENKSDLFAISGITESELSLLVSGQKIRKFEDGDHAKKVVSGQKIRKFEDDDHDEEEGPIRFILLAGNDTRENFIQLCCDYEKHTIHLLDNKSGELEWKQSHGSLFNLRRFIETTENPKENVNDLTDSVVIIAGEPGMGKSTILTTYSLEIGSLIWSIRINFKDHEKHIENASFNNLSEIVNFLSKIAPEDLKSSLAKSLLGYRLEQQGKVTLLLDGYDEIKDHKNKEKVVELLKTLKTNTQGKVLLTTRLYSQPELEDALGIFSYILNPFSKEDQEEFLQEFWVKKLSDEQEPLSEEHKQRVKDFTKKFLQHFHNLNLMKEKGFVGIALQARMLAEVFQDKCDDYRINPNKKLNFPDIDIFDLYEHFIDVQYKIYLRKVKFDKKLDDSSKNALTRSYTKGYGYLALKALFLEDQTAKKLLRKVIMEKGFSKKLTYEKLNEIGLIKKFKDKSKDIADFIHPTYAEYFVAKLLVNMLDKSEDNPKYNLAREFLLTHIFRDRNEVIRDFIEDSVKKENNENIQDKWKAIQDCDLLGVKKSKEIHILLSDEKRNVLSLNELLSKFQNATTNQGIYEGEWGYFYNYPIGKNIYEPPDTSLVSDLFYSFAKEKDVKSLQDTVEYLVKIENDGGLHLLGANAIMSENFDKAIDHYLVEAKQQGKLDRELKEKIDKRKSNLNKFLKEILKREKHKGLSELLGNFITLSDGNQKEQCLKSLEQYLIPDDVENFQDLSKLNDLYHLLDISDTYNGIIKKISSYIVSNKSVQRIYKNGILELLKNITINKGNNIDFALKPSEIKKSLQSFFIEITHHSNFIEDTKSCVNKIFEEALIPCLERQCILISRFLKILTLEMSEIFISELHDCKGYGAIYYSRSVCLSLINHILDEVKKEGIEGLPEINKTAFLKMLTCFTQFNIEVAHEPLTSDRLETILIFIEHMFKKQHLCIPEILESIQCLFVLRETGLKLIGIDQNLLAIDSASEFQYKLSDVYITQIIKVIKWRSKYPDQPESEFLQKCKDILKLKKNELKRRSESILQESKRLKLEELI